MQDTIIVDDRDYQMGVNLLPDTKTYFDRKDLFEVVNSKGGVGLVMPRIGHRKNDDPEEDLGFIKGWSVSLILFDTRKKRQRRRDKDIAQNFPSRKKAMAFAKSELRKNARAGGRMGNAKNGYA